MCFSSEPMLSAEEYRRAIEVVGILNGRGVRVLSVMFSAGCDFDVLVAHDNSVETLPNAVCFAVIRQQEVWQTNVWGVRVRWFKPVQKSRPSTAAIVPEEVVAHHPTPPDHGIFARLWQFLGVGHAH